MLDQSIGAITHPNAFISSTVLDMHDHRKAVIDAVWRFGIYPSAMEKDAADRDDAIAYSLRLTDQADIYIGIFGVRYGELRGPQQISITEMEYRLARQRGIPTLIFMMDEDNHLVKPGDVETDPARRAKLQQLKKELLATSVVGFFRSAEDLGHQVFETLAKLQMSGRLLPNTASSLSTISAIHAPSVAAIPKPPIPYLAHPYTLTHYFCGRRTELDQLDEWAASSNSILIIESIGGMGKSALAWHWIHERAFRAMPSLSGIVWWCFYESDATVTNFIRHALAYLTHRSLTSVDQLTRADREIELLQALRAQPCLVVLDGLERILVAYHRMDAPYRSDAQVEEETNETNEATPVGNDAQTGSNKQKEQHRHKGTPSFRNVLPQRQPVKARQCTDPRDAAFLRKLLACSPSKVLINTRLVPEEYYDRGSREILKDIHHMVLEGLSPDDALAFWNILGVRGEPNQMQVYLAQFGYHALLTEVLAGRITRHFPAPGDFSTWITDEGSELSLTSLDLAQRRTHILHYALDGLAPEHRTLLCRVAAFRYPVDYTALAALNPYASTSSKSSVLEIPPLPPNLPTKDSERITRWLEQRFGSVKPKLSSPEEQYDVGNQSVLTPSLYVRKELKALNNRIKQELEVRGIFAEISDSSILDGVDLLSETDAEVYQNELTLRIQQLENYETAVNAAFQTALHRAEELHQHSQRLFHQALAELEERGLLHWDRKVNRYDLHPIVRAVAFEGLTGDERTKTFLRIRDHFESLPPEQEERIHDIGDLRGSLEIYHALIGADFLDEAALFYGNRLRTPLEDRLGLYLTIVELLSPLFPRGTDDFPGISDLGQQIYRMNDLSRAFSALERYDRALIIDRLLLQLDLSRKVLRTLSIDLENHAIHLWGSRERIASLRALGLAETITSSIRDNQDRPTLHLRKLKRAVDMGRWAEARVAYQEFVAYEASTDTALWLCEAEHYHAKICLHFGRAAEAAEAAANSRELAQLSGDSSAQLLALRTLAIVAFRRRDYKVATDQWQDALALARRSGVPTSEYLAQLAHVRALQNLKVDAHQFIQEALDEDPEHLPFCIMAEVFLALGKKEQAERYALASYRDAWGEGPPYILSDELERSRKVLRTLRIPEPVLPCIDPTQVRSIPFEQEILDLVRAEQRKPLF